ncbi:TPA: ead/Ea22-like family protein [Escherichia coli]|nr:ead/Ea22-like family protein [Escherichia coli]
MSKINYQALREAAQNYQSTLAWYEAIPDSPCSEVDCDRVLAAFKCQIRHREMDIIADLLDELDEKQHYIKLRDQENEEIALTIGKLRIELEEAKSKLNEQREYYKSVIADGSNRIAELEEIATDYALKFQKAQDALKHSVLMRNKSLSFEKAVRHPTSECGTFTVEIPNPKEYFINGVFQPLRYERDVERAIIKAGGKVS